MAVDDVTLLLAGGRLPDGRLADIAVAGARIAAVTEAGRGAAAEGAMRLACEGRLVAPSFVEGHIHLDKTLLGLPWIPHQPGGSVAERIAAEKALRRTLDLPVEARGGRLIEQIVGFGTGTLRSHVDIDTELGLSHLEAVLALRERYREVVDIQIVAFPQSGILRDPGTADLLAAALEAGADLVGGLDPAGIDGAIDAHLDIVFGLAARFGRGVDIHLHDGGELGAFELRQIAARAEALGMQGRVAVDHAYALGEIGAATFGATAEALARGGVAIMSNAPGTGPIPPALRLAAAGVRVFAGSDNIRDAWWPYGDGDMLDRAHMIGYRQGFHTDAELERAFAMTTGEAAAALGLTGYGLAPGDRADLMLLDAPSVAEAVVSRPAARLVVKRGRVVAGGSWLQES